jgi:hypothetical protein
MGLSNSRQSGSTLVLVLGAVIIAAMIAVSYLIFTDNLRERAARTLDQEQRTITTEQVILEKEKQIREDLLRSASMDLGNKDTVADPSLFLRATLVGQGDSTNLSVTPIVEDIGKLSSLDSKDPFGAAKARVQLIDLQVVSKETPDGRLANLQLTATPQIAVREIPVSQFTVYSAGDPFLIGPTPFGGDVGRVFSESNITVTGSSFSSFYPIVSAGQVTFSSGSIRVADANGSGGLIGLSMNTSSPDTGASYAFLAAARTQLDSKLITSDVLPVACAPLNELYDAGARKLNFAFLKAQCDLVVVAYVGGSFNEKTGYQMTIIGKNGALYTALQPGENRPKESVPLVAYPDKDNPGRVFLAFNYKKLSGNFASVYLVAQDNTGKPASNAIVLIRGAKILRGPLSIVTPHPIVIAGDFNEPSGVACSIITAEDVQTQPADWRKDIFGPP